MTGIMQMIASYNIATTVTISSGNVLIPPNILVVAGGGGGSTYGGAGGGGGGILANVITLTPGTTYTVTVGTGGVGGGVANVRANNGTNSSFASPGFANLIAIGGGSGGTAGLVGNVGGAGGGAGFQYTGSPAQGTAGQGGNGGTVNTSGNASVNVETFGTSVFGSGAGGGGGVQNADPSKQDANKQDANAKVVCSAEQMQLIQTIKGEMQQLQQADQNDVAVKQGLAHGQAAIDSVKCEPPQSGQNADPKGLTVPMVPAGTTIGGNGVNTPTAPVSTTQTVTNNGQVQKESVDAELARWLQIARR